MIMAAGMPPKLVGLTTVILAVMRQVTKIAAITTNLVDTFICYDFLLFSNQTPNGFTIALVKIGTDNQKNPQTNEGYNTIDLLQCKYVINEDLDNRHYQKTKGPESDWPPASGYTKH